MIVLKAEGSIVWIFDEFICNSKSLPIPKKSDVFSIEMFRVDNRMCDDCIGNSLKNYKFIYNIEEPLSCRHPWSQSFKWGIYGQWPNKSHKGEVFIIERTYKIEVLLYVYPYCKSNSSFPVPIHLTTFLVKFWSRKQSQAFGHIDLQSQLDSWQQGQLGSHIKLYGQRNSEV